MKNIINSRKGFTSMELILTILIMSIVMIASAETIATHTDAFSFITNRKSTVADLRFALNKMTTEMEKINAGDITDIQTSRITFTDSATGPVTYKQHVSDTVVRNNDVLLKHVSNMWFDYYDSLGNPLTPNSSNLPNVRRIKVSVKSKPRGKEGNITISAYVVPLAFLGYNLQ